MEKRLRQVRMASAWGRASRRLRAPVALAIAVSAVLLVLPAAAQSTAVAPTGLAATAAAGQVLLDWADSSEAGAAYNVYRSTTTPVSTAGAPLNGSTLLTSSSYVDTAVSNGTIYHYVVTAVVGGTSSTPSAMADAMPDAANAVPLTLPARFNFQSESAPVPAGSTRDYGLNYANVRGFGWVAAGTTTSLSLVGNGRDRDRTGIDQRLDTLLHMQANDIVGTFSGVKAAGAWQLAIPNGTYQLVVSVGDAPSTGGVYDSDHTINAEGAKLIDRFKGTATQEYKEAKGTVVVNDGALTIDAVGGTNTKLNYVEVFAASDTTPPAAPAGVGAAAGDGSATIAWTGNSEPDLAGYNLFRSTSAPVSTAGTPLNGTALLTTTRYTDTGLSNGTTYHYVVEAVDRTGNRAASASVATTPAAQSSTTAAAAASIDLKVNFQSETAPVPSGYVRDFGEGYGPRTGASQGTGWQYGWVTPGTATPLSLVGNGRDRNRAGIDQRLDTLMHMQANDIPGAFAGVKAAGAWEVAVENGSYQVVVSVGDAPGGGGLYDSDHTINAEGVKLIDRFKGTAAQEFKQATGTVTVSDGRLTIDAVGGTNSKINYLHVVTSGGDTTPPAVPTSVSASPGNAQATISWNANAEPDLAGYNIYRGTALPVATTTPLNGATLLSINSFVNTGLTNGTTYHYVVEAVDFTGNRAAAAPVSVTPVAETTIDLKVNFQSETAAVPPGYLRDFGEAYGPRTGADQGSGRTYGWVTPETTTPVNLVGNGRDRNLVTDQRLDTFMHMQADQIMTAFTGVKKAGAWEIAVPNGAYTVAVSVGDAGFLDSAHRINLEGQVLIFGFTPTTANKFATATKTVNVADGRLTVDAEGGTNTKINYVELVTAPGAANRPSVTSSIPANGTTAIRRDVSVTAEVSLPNAGAGIDPATLTAATVKLVRMSDSVQLPANLNTSGGGDVIVLHPTALLSANTQYRFEVNDGVKDFSGAGFLPWTSTFTTGTAGGPTSSAISFEKVALPSATGKSFTSVTIGPDGKLYAGTIDGEIVRFPLNADGTTGTPEVITSLQAANGGPRMLVGLTFDPASTASNLILWVSHSLFAFNSAPDWEGKITRLSGPNLETVQDYVVNLPRSIRDHVTNSIAFGPDGGLYFLQGSNTATGAPDNAWGNRPERVLNAALLRLNVAGVTAPPLDAKTEDGGSYNPFAAGAPLTIYASGIRNAFDLVWHSNGQLYVPTNGSAAGGNTPGSPATLPASCSNRIDKPTNGNYTGPQVPGIQNLLLAQPDYLYRIVKDKYYGHPNPARCEWTLNGGNPTSGADPGQITQYPVGTSPDRNWGGFSWDIGTHYSPNGVIEYKSNVLGGALRGKLILTRYSAGDDLLVMTPGGATLDILDAESGITGFTGLTDPLDLTENTANGNLYVTELGSSLITLLRPIGGTGGGTPNVAVSPARLIYNDVQNGAASAAKTVTIENTGTGPLTVSGLTIGGADASQFQLSTPPTLPATVPAGGSLAVNVVFNPTSTGPKGAQLQVASNDLDTPQSLVTLRGLGTLGLGGTNEPSLQWILDTYEIPVNVGDPDPTTGALPADPLLGEEVSAQRFEKAVATDPVSVEVLAVFGPNGPGGTVVTGGRYAPGPTETQVFSVANASSQSLVPATTGTLTFDPGTAPFGLYSTWPFFADRDVFGEDALNTWEATAANRHKVRVYPLKATGGAVVPNAYVVATEETTSGFDYQDVVLVVRNVKPSVPPPGNGDIDIENLDSVPYPDRLAFSRIGTLATPPANGVHDRVTLRVKNTASEQLLITGLPITGPWQLVTPPALPAAIPGGGQLDVQVRFVATAGDQHNGTLTVQSNDADEPSTVVQLSGFWQSVSEGNQEPTLVEMLKTLGYTQTIAGAGELLGNKGILEAIGEEVMSPYWQRVDTTKPVSVRQLAAYHGCCTQVASLSWHNKGSNVVTFALNHAAIDSQSLLPRKNSTVVPPPPTPAAATFTPGVTFGFRIDGSEWSDPTKNNQAPDTAAGCPGPCGHHVRFWPIRDRAGVLVPNTYLMTMDYAGINYDYNDNVYLLSNIKPENAAVNPFAPGLLPGAAGLVLDFDRAYAGTLADKDGQTTGFTSTQPNKLDVATGSNSSQAALRDVVITGQGTFALTSTAGSNGGTDNTLVNGLQTAFDSRNGVFTVGTRLVGPLTAINAGVEQAGVMFGSDQDNFVKLAAMANAGAPALQFYSEQNAVGVTVGALTPLANPDAITSLDLYLVGDPAAGTVRAAYRAISGTTDSGLVFLPTPLTIPAGQVGRFFGLQTKGGILATHKLGAQFVATFDRFAVTPGGPAAPAPQEALYRLDVAGAGNYTDTSARTWTPDTGRFTPSTAIAEGGGLAPLEIANTNDDVLYQTYRGNVGAVPLAQRVLNYTLPTGTLQRVDLILHFAERHSGNNAVGKRVFDVEAEGDVILDDFDIFAASGGLNTAIAARIDNITLAGGVLNLTFRTVVDYASIAAIEVLCQGTCSGGGDLTPPAVPSGLTATGSGTGITLDWANNAEADLGGYNVYRSATATGTYTKLNTALLTASAYNDTTAPTGATSFYRVTALDTSGNESGPATANATRAALYALQMSVSSNRSAPVALAGRTVSGNIYAFTTPTTDVLRVRFFVDNPAMTATPVTDVTAPYDAKGTRADGTANPFNTSLLTNGAHTLTAAVDKAAGGTEVHTATFTVNNTVNPTTFAWSTVAPSPIGRLEPQAAQVNGKFYVFGGYTAVSATSATLTPRSDAYDPITNTWTRTADMPKAVTHAGAAVGANRYVYLAGGYVSQNATNTGGQILAVRDTWRYDTTTNAWTALPPLPAARGAGALALINNQLHFFGGHDAARVDKGDHWVLTIGGTAWTTSAALPTPRNHLGTAVLGGKIYAVGGKLGNDSGARLTAVHVWNPAAPGAWTVAASIPVARSHILGATFVMGNRIVIAGGDTNTTNQATALVSAYNPTTNSWATLTPLPAARHSGAATALGNQIFFTTGSLQTTSYQGVPSAPTAFTAVLFLAAPLLLMHAWRRFRRDPCDDETQT